MCRSWRRRSCAKTGKYGADATVAFPGGRTGAEPEGRDTRPPSGRNRGGPFGNGRRRLRPFAGGLYLREAPVRLREGADMRPVGGGGRIPHDAPERCMPVSGTAGARLCRPEPSGCPKCRAGSVRSRRGPVDEYVGLPGSGRRSRTARSFTAGVSSKLGKRFSAGRRLVRGMRRLRSVRSMAGDVRRSAVRGFTAPPADFLGRGGADRFDRGGARTADAAAAHDRYGFAYDDTMH